jgi:hypothetical protein
MDHHLSPGGDAWFCTAEQRGMAAWKIGRCVRLRGLLREDWWRALKERSEAWFVWGSASRRRFFFPLPISNQGDETRRDLLKAGRYQFEGFSRVGDNKCQQKPKPKGNQQLVESAKQDGRLEAYQAINEQTRGNV